MTRPTLIPAADAKWIARPDDAWEETIEALNREINKAARNGAVWAYVDVYLFRHVDLKAIADALRAAGYSIQMPTEGDIMTIGWEHA